MRGGFYNARHITRKEPVKKILFAKFGSIRFVCETWNQETAANLLPKNQVSSDSSHLPSLSDFSASSFSLGRAIIGPSPIGRPPATEKGVEHAHLPIRVAERDQVLGEDTDGYWSTVRHWRLVRR